MVHASWIGAQEMKEMRRGQRRCEECWAESGSVTHADKDSPSRRATMPKRADRHKVLFLSFFLFAFLLSLSSIFCDSLLSTSLCFLFCSPLSVNQPSCNTAEKVIDTHYLSLFASFSSFPFYSHRSSVLSSSCLCFCLLVPHLLLFRSFPFFPFLLSFSFSLLSVCVYVSLLLFFSLLLRFTSFHASLLLVLFSFCLPSPSSPALSFSFAHQHFFPHLSSVFFPLPTFSAPPLSLFPLVLHSSVHLFFSLRFLSLLFSLLFFHFLSFSLTPLARFW